MRKAILSLVAVFAVAVVLWAGGDPWKTKPFSQWTEKDVQDTLQNSPWAKANLQAQGAWRPDGMTQASGSTSIAGTGSGSATTHGSVGDSSNTSAGVMPGQPGGLEKSAAADAARVPYSIFWWSSRTIRAASMRRQVLKGTMTEADAEKAVAASPDEYMILVQAANMAIFQLRGEKAFDNAAYLQTKKVKAKISPSHVAFLRGSDGQSVTGAIFYFPKKGASGEPTISSDEKEVDFYLQVGDAKLLTYFEPKKMIDSQGEDL